MAGSPEQFDQPDEQAPEELHNRLAKLYAANPPVQRQVDDAILKQARRRLGGYRKVYLVLRWGGAAAAAAAVLLICLRLADVWPASRSTARPIAVRIEQPTSADRVTILDAYRLARLLESGKPASSQWDADGNGVVDQRDVDAIARAAVRLGGGAVR